MQDKRHAAALDASFRKAWAGSGPAFYGYAAHVPRVTARNRALDYAGEPHWGSGGGARFLTLILGEIPPPPGRAEGYGPRARASSPLDVPEDVLRAFDLLTDASPAASPRWRGTPEYARAPILVLETPHRGLFVRQGRTEPAFPQAHLKRMLRLRLGESLRATRQGHDAPWNPHRGAV
jgi:hypothetical protein